HAGEIMAALAADGYSPVQIEAGAGNEGRDAGARCSGGGAFARGAVHPPGRIDAGKPCLGGHAPQVRSGGGGRLCGFVPDADEAPMSALVTAGSAPTQPASPAPLTPSGLVLVGTGLLSTSMSLRSRARGMV